MYSKGKKLDFKLLLNRISSICKPIEEEAPEDDSLQAAITAQIRTNEYKGLQGNNWASLKSIQNPRPYRAEQE